MYYCLLSFSLKCELDNSTQQEADDSNLTKLGRKYVWRPEHSDQYTRTKQFRSYIYILYVQARSAYKVAVRNAKYDHAKRQTDILNKAKRKNAKEYWKLLKNMGSTNRAKGLSANNFLTILKP